MPLQKVVKLQGNRNIHARVAQWIEQRPSKAKVTGSSPVSGTIGDYKTYLRFDKRGS